VVRVECFLLPVRRKALSVSLLPERFRLERLQHSLERFQFQILVLRLVQLLPKVLPLPSRFSIPAVAIINPPQVNSVPGAGEDDAPIPLLACRTSCHGPRVREVIPIHEDGARAVITCRANRSNHSALT